ncbi:hypothetical protein SPRG_12264 [Saprolegnia parasitica CBS 223.65]|uniref:LNR domain-containing protein n=1 Tax=Saprolegnia parasitica (strain CBS 223.65) TaxID=695850 RepID=A0A067C0J8_SAPPC|nr:hypothetical protein SPRG_12264 [Saprolegnia parasitica CBS 223.65]KDO22625.1 hypothetical protein SPRG_12264 [Saprolegnia parasitica CBS 223.65]|eukprot:XP_012206644.1 hypothetical protein SPRG_12264 [Saprolegnia parasitica CBS 223.65]
MHPVARQVILVLAFLKLLASGTYCLLMAALLRFASPSDAIKYQIFAMTTYSFGTYAACGLLYWLGALHVLCGRRPSCVDSLSCRLTSSTSALPWALGVQILQTCVQLLQAYRLSQHAVNLDIAFVYPMLVGLSTAVSPWFFLFTDPFVHRDLWLLFNCLLSFVLASGLYLVAFVPPLLSLKFGDPRQAFSMAWTTEYTLLTRYMVPMSPIDLAEKATLFGLSWFNAQRLVANTHRRHAVAPLHRGPTRVTIRSKPRAFRVLLWCNLLLGLSIVVAAVVSVARAPACPDGCLLATHPWFAAQCECAFFHLRCEPHNMSPNLTRVLSPAQLGTQLFYLHVTECPLVSGLDLSHLAPFKQLFGLTIEFSDMTTWDNNDLAWPDSVLAIEVRYSNLSYLPPALLKLPRDCTVLTLAFGNNMSALPSTLVPAWQSLSRLVLNGNQLTVLPRWVDQLQTLERIVVSSNLFTELPEATLTTLPVLTHIEAAQNALTVFPRTLAAAKQVEVIDVSNNPISEPPTDGMLAAIAARRVLADGTPACTGARPLEGCQAVCADSCSNFEHGDRICQANCLHEACNWDKMDCANGGSQ